MLPLGLLLRHCSGNRHFNCSRLLQMTHPHWLLGSSHWEMTLLLCWRIVQVLLGRAASDLRLRLTSRLLFVDAQGLARIKLFIIVNCQKIRIGQLRMLIIKRFQNFFKGDKILKRLPRWIILLLPEDQKLSPLNPPLLILHLPRLQYLPHLVVCHFHSLPHPALEHFCRFYRQLATHNHIDIIRARSS